MRRVCILALGLCAVLRAEPAAAFSSGAILLTSPANARSTAMGDIGVSDNSDPSTIFFNPANVCAAPRVYALASQQRYELFDDLKVRRANAGFSWQSGPRSPWTLGADIGYGRLSYGEVITTNPEGTVLDSVDTYEDVVSLAAGLGFHASNTLEFRFGGAVKIWRAHFASPDVSADESVLKLDATSFDAGLAVSLHERYGAWNITPSIAAAVIDMGQDVEDPRGGSDPLPSRLNAGASVRIESSPVEVMYARVPLIAVVCQADGIKPLHDDREWGIGTEIAVAQILFLRNGVRWYTRLSGEDVTYASWGAGVGIPAGGLRMRFDYGRQTNTYEKDHMDVLLEWSF